jgi:Mg-chelatase subunit ChlD
VSLPFSLPFYFERPAVLVLLLLLLPAMAGLWLWRGRRTVPISLGLRLASVALIILAIANPTQGRPLLESGPLVLLVDQSDSLTPQGQAALRAEANRLLASLEDEPGEASERAVVLWFGDHVVSPGDWQQASAQAAPPPELASTLDGSQSNMAAALRTARDLLTTSAQATGESGQIVLLSDGLPTRGDALAEARLAADAGMRVDVLHLANPGSPELRIAYVDAPDTLHVGQEYSVNIIVDNAAPAGQTPAGQATLRLWEGDQLLGEQVVALAPGSNRFTFDSQAINAGVVRLRAEIEGTPDTFAQNNSGAATAIVAPPPLVLLVEGEADAAAPLSAALWSAGIENDVIAASNLTTRLSELNRYDGMVLVDVPANDLSYDQMTSVQEFVRSEGRGLVVTGGPNSYGLGGYDDTPLEEALPVDMQAPPRPERSEVALLLIVDRSASMDTALSVSKFDMAKEAAILATETLRQEDTIGVLAFDTGQEWTVPFQPIGQGASLQQIQDSIATLPTGGGTDIYRALEVGMNELLLQTAEVRHVVLLTDGRSFTDDRVAYQQLAQAALAQDITLSTIAIGFDSDTELLNELAQWGGGRYYFADDPEDIPRLTLQESEIARSDPSIEGTFRAELAQPHALVRDFVPAELPTLDGYVGTTAKESAEVVLRSPDQDPILSSWQYGLGRAIAWTPSAAAPWSNTWVNWPQYGRYWAQVVRYTLPDVNSGPLQVELHEQPGGARLVARAVQTSGEPFDLATSAAEITLPNGTQRTITLRQVAPGTYAQDLALPNAGPYSVNVALERDDQLYQTRAGYVHAVSEEYLPPQASSDDLRGLPLLQQIAAITDGRVLESTTSLERPADEGVDPQIVQEDPLRNVWMWLLGAALVCWLLEIAIRRGIFVRDR